MKTLHLTLKKQYFNEILAGEKTEEYRELKSYWISRLLKGGQIEGLNESLVELSAQEYNDLISDLQSQLDNFDSAEDLLEYFGLALDYYDQIIFRNGYAKNAPTIIVEWKGIQIKECDTPLGNKWQFAIKLGKILETKNIKEVTK